MSRWGSRRVQGAMRKIGRLRMLVGLGFVAVLLLGPAFGAVANAGGHSVVAQETPYEPPDIDEIEPPGWLAFLEPIAALPLWGQAAVLSAGVAGMFFVVPMVFRWVWRLGPDSEEDDEAEEHQL
jgi:hypothetical protein